MPEMPDVLKLHADGTPDKHAVIVDASHGARPSVTTFAELNQLVNRLVHGLRAARRASRATGSSGAARTRSRSSRSSTRPGRPGLVAVPLSYRFNADEMQYVIDNSDATLVISDAEYAPVVAAARDRLPKVRAYVGFAATDDAPELPAGWKSWDDVTEGQSGRRAVGPGRLRGRGADALHVGHHREAEGRAAHHHQPRGRASRCSASSACSSATRCTSRPARCTTRARSRSCRSTTRSARRSSCCAASTRSRGSRR